MEPPPEAEDPDCTFGRCFCRWLRFCSPEIPHVAPDLDYERVPPDDRAAWSLLLGFITPSASNNCLLRLRRFRVARCGRILGRSDEALEILDDLDYGSQNQSARICASAVTPCPDSSTLSLCLFFREFGLDHPSKKIEPPIPVELHLDLNTSRIIRSPLPNLAQDPLMPTCPISAGAHLWAPYFTQRCPPQLMMRRLDKEIKKWEEVGVAFLHRTLNCAIHGYAVVGNTILLSMQPRHFFLAFDCSTLQWTVVTTIGSRETEYIPILDRGLYVEEENTIYFLRKSTVYAYNLCVDQDQHLYSMAPPTVVNHVFPFRSEGYGFLTYLGCRIMCSVWIGVPSRYGELRCNCDALHMLITTFRVMGIKESNGKPFVPKGVQVLHSTCRRLDKLPSVPSDCRFYFLQEYEEFCHNEDAMPPAKKKKENAMEPPMLLEFTEARSNLLGSSKLLTCCRKYWNELPFVDAVRLECSAIQINKALYIICQDDLSSTVYEVTVSGGRLSCQNKTLTKCCVIDSFPRDDAHDPMKGPRPWHFVYYSTDIFAFPYGKSEMYRCGINMGTVELHHAKKPSKDEYVSIALVLRVGDKIVAISDSLDRVYVLHYGNWEYLMICQPVDSGRKIEISGYVVLNDESFMVSDAKSCYCYLFSIDNDTRSVVQPYSEDSSFLRSSVKGFLSGRSVFAEGFIYTCVFGGLAAYEIFEAEDSFYIGSQIKLDIPWRKEWKRESMCLDYLGKDEKSGAVIFCVVQGDTYYPRPGALHKQPVWITTIQVKTERMPNDKLKPVVIGHLDVSTSFTERDEGRVWTTNCFVDAGSF